MQKKITFRGRDHSDVLDQQINQQLEKVEALLESEPSPVILEVTVEFHETHQYNKVTAHVKSPHFSCHCTHEGPDVHAEINEVIDRLYTQLRRDKKKLVDSHKHGCDKRCKEALFKEINRESRELHQESEQEDEE